MIAVVLLVLIVVAVYFGRRKYIAQKEFRDHVKAHEATTKALNGSNTNAGGYDQFGNGVGVGVGGDINGGMMMSGGSGMPYPMDRTSSFGNQQQSPMMTHGYGMQPDTFMVDINTAGSYPDVSGGIGSIDGGRQRGVTSQFEPEW